MAGSNVVQFVGVTQTGNHVFDVRLSCDHEMKASGDDMNVAVDVGITARVGEDTPTTTRLSLFLTTNAIVRSC